MDRESQLSSMLYIASSWVKPNDDLILRDRMDFIVSRHANRGDWFKTKATLWFKMNTKEDLAIKLRFRSSKSLKFHFFLIIAVLNTLFSMSIKACIIFSIM